MTMHFYVPNKRRDTIAGAPNVMIIDAWKTVYDIAAFCDPADA
jgi:hypothetical protein